MFKTATARALLGAGAVLGILAVTGTVSTAGNTMPAATSVLGYGSQTITGVVAESIEYNLDGSNATIESVTVVLTGDTRAGVIEISFNDAVPALCSGAGVYAAGTDDTSYLCDIVDMAVSTATKFAIVSS